MPRAAAPRIGYLTDHYPATSHTFVQREVLALRRLGIDVHTFSTHRVGPEHVLSVEDERAYGTTFSVLPIGLADLLRRHAGALAAAPAAYLRTLASAILRGDGARARLWQMFYFAEAVVLWRECRARGITHLHAHFTRPAADTALLVAKLGSAAGEPWSWSFSAHGADIYDTDPASLASKVHDARFVICVSDYGRGQLMNLVDESHWEKLRVVRCGIDPARYPAAHRRGSSSSVRLLTVGRLVPVKGHAVLLEAVAALKAAGIRAELTIVGDGPRRQALEQHAGTLAIADQVRFAGRIGQDHLLRYYEDADIFVLTSFAEGIPVVLMEAMATELPVVSSNITGIPELVNHGSEGLLVPAGRTDLFAEAIATLARHPNERLRMGREGRRRVMAEYEISRSAGELARTMREFGALPADEAARAMASPRKATGVDEF